MMTRVFYILLYSFTPFGCCISFSPESSQAWPSGRSSKHSRNDGSGTHCTRLSFPLSAIWHGDDVLTWV